MRTGLRIVKTDFHVAVGKHIPLHPPPPPASSGRWPWTNPCGFRIGGLTTSDQQQRARQQKGQNRWLFITSGSPLRILRHGCSCLKR